MSVELTLLNNVINNFINKKFTLDGASSQLVSILTINVVNILYNNIKEININDYILNNINLFSNHLNNIYYLIIVYIFYIINNKYNIIDILKKISCKLFNIIFLILKKNYYVKVIINYYKSLYITIEDNEIQVVGEKKCNNLITYEIDLSDMFLDILNIYKFINLHPDMFNTNISHKIINYDNNVFYIYKDKLNFNDIIHNVTGSIETACSTYKIDNKTQYNIVMILTITKNKNDKEKYITQIKNYLYTQMRHGNDIKLKYYKVLPKEMITHIFYENDIKNWYTDIKLLKNEFFSEHKDYLFSVMESKKEYHITKSNTWNNLLLYGPPGLGKSSLIYRIATLLKKSIISIDISQYINKKKELYSLFLSGSFELPDDSTKINIDSNFIIILEEFDYTIDKLIELEEFYKYKKLVTNQIFKQQHNKLHENITSYTELDNNDNDYDNDYDVLIKNNISTKPLSSNLDETINYNSYLNKEIQKEIKNEKENNNNNNNIKHNKDNRKFNDDICKITIDINNNIQQINNDNKSDILRLSDLLELFQGPVPIKDRMIIATTNNFDKIKDSLPALIRPGRLTPIKFDYMSWDILNSLTMYYFNKKMQSKEFKIIIPTSQIIELVQQIISLNLSINDFEIEIKKLCIHN
jgi:hypothetical protein